MTSAQSTVITRASGSTDKVDAISGVDQLETKVGCTAPLALVGAVLVPVGEFETVGAGVSVRIRIGSGVAVVGLW
jgi:hypothetical protein